MILVGAPTAAIPGGNRNVAPIGVVYGFLPGRGQYIESLQLYQSSDAVPFQDFGSSIAMFGELIAVGGSKFKTEFSERRRALL